MKGLVKNCAVFVLCLALPSNGFCLAPQIQVQPTPIIYVSGGIVAQNLTINSGQIVWLDAGGVYYFNSLIIQSNGILSITNKTPVAKWTQIVCTNFSSTASGQFVVQADHFWQTNGVACTSAVVAWDGRWLSNYWASVGLGGNGSTPTGGLPAGNGNLYGGGGGGGENSPGISATYLRLGQGPDGLSSFNNLTWPNSSILNGNLINATWAPSTNGPGFVLVTDNDQYELDGGGGYGGANGFSGGALYFRVLSSYTGPASVPIIFQADASPGGTGGPGGNAVNLAGAGSYAYGGGAGGGGGGGNGGQIVFAYPTAGVSGITPALQVNAGSGGTGGAGGTATDPGGTAINAPAAASGTAGRAGSSSKIAL